MIIFSKIFLPISSLLVSIAGLAVLTVFAATKGSVHVISFVIFGSALIIVYGVYVAYHILLDTQHEAIVRKFHNAAMCALISGTYTPIYLLAFGGGWGWSMFGITWGLTLLAFLLLFFKRAPAKLILATFIIIDWLIVIAFYPLYTSLPFFAIKLLALGSALYTTSAIMDKVGKYRLSQINMLLGSSVHIWFMYAFLLN